jgi:hypothetical protein
VTAVFLTPVENLGSEVDVVFTLDERTANGQASAATWDSHPNGRFTARLEGGCRLDPGDPRHDAELDVIVADPPPGGTGSRILSRPSSR